ncbi:MAG: bifunctional diaminohydroxyphosphoribosylaminopyrimidine deaminase/5-amino-6-(5-phosphoribosylamino)uracil reductase RibD [Planctomycetes bacterium]|nr:bifunctional diaminohydroxyphosphoribosylaminopyrimidine deaminase/5-amino-6-(5-phosphoribosylamino)uracil reductase RibD [Planctomycetota bacterium]
MEYSREDINHMKRALKHATRGIGFVEPNPAVGCVIVKGNQVIGQGWHKKFGDAHAEVNAIEDCKELGATPKGSTMFVTLEPCCHHGKTPPCTQAIIDAKIKKVFIAIADPSEHVAGKGIEQLKEAGIEVDIGLCQHEAKLLNPWFIKYAQTKRPWTLLKWAQSIDGKLAYANVDDEHRWISNESSRKDVHALRRQCQGILVGINTVLADDPQLTPRPPRGKKPARIVLDSKLRIPLTCTVMRTTKSFPTIVVTTHQAATENQKKLDRIVAKGAEVIVVPSLDGKCDLAVALDGLGDRGIAQLLVEGGREVIASFIRSNLADEARIYIAPKFLGPEGNIDILETLTDITADLKHTSVTDLDGDTCIRGLFRDI